MVSQQLIIQCDECSVIYISNKSQYLKNEGGLGTTAMSASIKASNSACSLWRSPLDHGRDMYKRASASLQYSGQLACQ